MASHRLSDADILAQIAPARARERQERKRGLRTRNARYDRATERIVLELTNGVLFAFPVESIPALRSANTSQRAAVHIDASGSTLRWDSLDVDLSVPGLLLSAVGAKEKQRHLASLVGKSTSPAKAAASRANGAKGGRPRKTAL